MKRLILFLFFVIPTVAFGQVAPPSTYTPQLITYQGVPFGVCSVYQIAENVTNGQYYTCNISTHSWQSVSSGTTNPGGSSGQLQYNNTTFGGVTGSSVNAGGQIILTPSVDGNSALILNPTSQNFGSASPVLNINGGAGTITCQTLGGFAPAEVCINGATNQPWLYTLSILGDATNTASPTIALWDTSRTTPNQALALLNVTNCSSNYGTASSEGCLLIGYQSKTDGLSSFLNINEDGSAQWGLKSPDSIMSWGTQGDIPAATVNGATGEFVAGWIPNSFAITGFTGSFSIVDSSAGHGHKVSITEPGTVSANYNFALPVTAGSAGQALLSQGGGTTPMTWSASTLPSNVLISSTAPSVAAGGCGGSGASITLNNGTAAFTVNVGTSNTGTCTITMPAANTDWNCGATDITTTSTLVSITKAVPGGTPATQVTLQNYTDIFGTHAWTDSDKIQVRCMAE